mmetsp:Transcript_45934/g.121810  ORF Transcript_45934/g.121810 Transcript_45934/m.121810 type:complete len:248 (-) Transcript_45934:626-1369(-)
MNHVLLHFLSAVQEMWVSNDLLAGNETNFVQILQRDLATIKPSHVELIEMTKYLHRTLEIRLIHVEGARHRCVQHAPLDSTTDLPTTLRTAEVRKNLMEELHETKLSTAADSKVSEGLRVEQLARHCLVGVDCCETFLRDPRVEQFVSVPLSVPNLQFVIHHAQQMRPHLVVANALHHVPGNTLATNVYYVLLVEALLIHIRSTQHPIHDADVHFVLNVVFAQVSGDSVREFRSAALLLPVEALHES